MWDSTLEWWIRGQWEKGMYPGTNKELCWVCAMVDVNSDFSNLVIKS